MQLSFPKEGTKFLVDFVESLNKKDIETFEFSFDKFGMKIKSKELVEAQNGIDFVIIKWKEEFRDLAHKYYFNNSFTKFYSIFKDAVENNIDVNINIVEDDSKVFINEIFVTNSFNTKRADIGNIEDRDTGSFLTVTKEELKKNFEDQFEFTKSIGWVDEKLSGVSFLLKGDELKKVILSSSCLIVNDDIYGNIDKRIINERYRHNKGHFIFTKEMYKIISKLPDDRLEFHFSSSYPLEEKGSNLKIGTFFVSSERCVICFNVVTRAKHWETYEINNNITQMPSANTFELDRDLFTSFFNKISNFKDFEYENIHFVFGNKSLRICDLQENDFAKFTANIKMKEEVKIAFNFYILNRIFKYTPEKAIIKFDFKIVSEDEKYIVITNDKNDRVSIVHAL